jgi:uncharacterized membrane protein YdfJ with MMPL/SSD domain
MLIKLNAMNTRKEEIDKINELYNLGEISISEANDKREAIKKMSDDKFAKTSTVNKNTVFELSYEDKVLTQLKMQNSSLSTIKAILVFYLCLSILGVFGTLLFLA